MIFSLKNDLKTKLLNRTKKTKSGCLEWRGSMVNSGYGRIKIKGRYFLAHRVSYALFIGEIPDGQIILHLCDNKKCINPEHLSLGSHEDNAIDMVLKNRGTSILNPSQVKAIRKDVGTLQSIADKYGVSVGAISHIKKGRNWKHVG